MTTARTWEQHADKYQNRKKIVILIYSQLKVIHQSKYMSDKIVSVAAKSCFLDDQVLTTKHTHTKPTKPPYCCFLQISLASLKYYYSSVQATNSFLMNISLKSLQSTCHYFPRPLSPARYPGQRRCCRRRPTKQAHHPIKRNLQTIVSLRKKVARRKLRHTTRDLL